jgi:release factor glutamine methyltransferase
MKALFPERPLSIKRANYYARTLLQEAGIDSFAIDARVLLENVLQRSPIWILTHPDFLLTSQQQSLYAQWISRRLKREPVEKICGFKEFWSLPFVVSTEVLTPRPDSETLIALTLELISDKNKSLRVLDLGTGSGCLLLALLKELPNATGVGVDINFSSLQIAQKNAEKLDEFFPGLYERVEFIQDNWGKSLKADFDVVISNPPYIPAATIPTLAEEVYLYDPLIALNGGISGVECYKEILAQLPYLLKPQGMVVFEVGVQQLSEILALLATNGLKEKKTKTDLQNIPRSVAAVYKDSF